MGNSANILFPRGTVVKIDGIPFELIENAWLSGNAGNLGLIDTQPLMIEETVHEPMTEDDESDEAEELVAKVVEMTERGSLIWDVTSTMAQAYLDDVSLSLLDLRWQLDLPQPGGMMPDSLPGMPPPPPMPRMHVNLMLVSEQGKTTSIKMSDAASRRMYAVLGKDFDDAREHELAEQRAAADIMISDVLASLEELER